MAGKPRQSRDEDLALALARGLSHAAAARTVGMSARTVQRRLESKEFRQRVQTLRGRLVEQAVGLLSATNTAAARTLRQLLRDDSPMIRLSAAKAILELGTKLRESLELQQRIEAVEQALKDQSE